MPSPLQERPATVTPYSSVQSVDESTKLLTTSPSSRGGGGRGWACVAIGVSVVIIAAVATAGGVVVQRELGSLQAAVTRVERDGAREREVAELEAALADERDAVAQLRARLASLNGTVASMEREVTNAQLKDEVDALRRDVAADESRLRDEVNGELASAEAAMRSDLAARDAALEAEIGETLARVNRTMRRDERAVARASASFSAYVGGVREDIDAEVGLVKDTIAKEISDVNKNLDKYVVDTNAQFEDESRLIYNWVAGTFVLAASTLSVRNAYSHVRHWNKPSVQRKILVVIWMVPVYGATSIGALVYPRFGSDLALARDLYEAYCIYMFLAMLIAILGEGETHKVIKLLVEHGEDELERHQPFPRCAGCHPSPCCGCAPPPPKAGERAHSFLWQCKLAAMQFVVLKPLLVFVQWLMVYLGVPEGALWDPASATFYTTWTMNFSVGFAFYGLLKFFHATEQHLAAHNPWPKFVCIKGVVFMTFWQGLVISLLMQCGFGVQDARAASTLQNFLICVEMFLASLAHAYVYGHQEWEPGWLPRQEHVYFSDNVAIGDFISDFKDVATGGHYDDP